MKKLLSFILLSTIFILNAQEISEFTDKKQNKISRMAIFPGCEKLNINDQNAMQICLYDNLNLFLEKKLQNFLDKMEKQGLTSAFAKIQFVIDENGKMVNIKPLKGGNEELGALCQNILNDVSKK